MFQPTFPFESERLIYRTYEHADLTWLHEMRLDEDLMRYVPFGGENEDKIKEVLERRKKLTKIEAPGDGIMCVMVEKDTGEPVGEMMLRFAEGFHDTGEVGFILRRDFAGKGYATEGGLEMMRLGFEEAKYHRMIGLCDNENEGSKATLRRLGMREEGVLRKATQKDGGWRDQAIYAALLEEWRNE